MLNSINTPKILFIGTFPPTEEGIATFNDDLATNIQKLLDQSAQCVVAAVNLRDTSPYYFDQRVLIEIDQDTKETYQNAARLINDDSQIKCVVIQHEYGIYGGKWGIYLCDMIEKINKPVVTIMHTVLKTHSYYPEQFERVTKRIVKRSDIIVVLSDKSKKKLSSLYPKATEKIHFIPHGIHPVRFSLPKKTKEHLGLSGRTVLTTFGLLSRGKGIEYVIKALPNVVDKHPDVLYQVLGQTHPVVRRDEGEVYRTELVNLVKKLNLRKNVRFIDRYLPLDELLMYLQGTDLYLSTSINKDQSVSGTFSYAIGSGRAVVTTNFTQAIEVVTKGMGIIIRPLDSKVWGNSINKMLSQKNLRKFHKVAYSKTRSMLWTNVAKNYINLFKKYYKNETSHWILPELNLDHMNKMTKKFGILQFAKYDIPSNPFGYTLDDNARALIAVVWMMNTRCRYSLGNYFKKYLNFISKSQRDDGFFTNYFDISMKSTKQNMEENPTEHYGRAMWALSEVLSSDNVTKIMKGRSLKLWKKSTQALKNIGDDLRPKAYLIKAIVIYNKKYPKDDTYTDILQEYADDLENTFVKNARKNWMWFEDTLTYNNAIIPESLVLAYQVTKKRKYLSVAKKAFSFLMKKTFMGEVYVPIGQSNWYKKGRRRSYYDQQPEDVCATVLGFLSIYGETRNAKYLRSAKNAFLWFLGNNLNAIPVYSSKNGGVFDGLTREGVNKNQGAESLVSYLLARINIESYFE